MCVFGVFLYFYVYAVSARVFLFVWSSTNGCARSPRTSGALRFPLFTGKTLFRRYRAHRLKSVKPENNFVCSRAPSAATASNVRTRVRSAASVKTQIIQLGRLVPLTSNLFLRLVTDFPYNFEILKVWLKWRDTFCQIGHSPIFFLDFATCHHHSCVLKKGRDIVPV